MASVAELRAEREKVSQQIEALRLKARDLSAMIREAEGPIPDRRHRKGRVGHTIAPSAK